MFTFEVDSSSRSDLIEANGTYGIAPFGLAFGLVALALSGLALCTYFLESSARLLAYLFNIGVLILRSIAGRRDGLLVGQADHYAHAARAPAGFESLVYEFLDDIAAWQAAEFSQLFVDKIFYQW